MADHPAPPTWPRWLADIHRLLSIAPQFVLGGQIRDIVLTSIDGQYVLLPLLDALWEALASRGYQFLLVYDRAVLDYAARIPVSVQHLSEAEHEFFTSCEKLAHIAHPIAAPDGSAPRYNPLFWLCHRETDLPSWFTLDNDRLHRLSLPPPGFEERQHAARLLAPSFADHATAPDAARAQFADSFAQLTDGLNLHHLFAIARLAEEQRLPLADVADAVRCFKVGALDNPWKKPTCATASAAPPTRSVGGSRARPRPSSRRWIS